VTVDAAPASLTLEDVRREIDAIDDGMLELLVKRFQLVEQVRALKQGANREGTALRPAREAGVLRRLLASGMAEGLNPELLVRLWPAIFCEASRRQAPFKIQVSKRLSETTGNRLRIRDYFPLVDVEECRDEAQALLQISAHTNDICIVETESPWIEPFVTGVAGKAKVIASLPVIASSDTPRLLVIGVALSEPSRKDETLILSNGSLPRDFSVRPNWQVKNGERRLSALPGFLSEKESPLLGLMRTNGNLGLKILGRYPSAFEL
jgi:chorismate mutase / prephenate dehydratase